jgi:hypothetical protein
MAHLELANFDTGEFNGGAQQRPVDARPADPAPYR